VKNLQGDLKIIGSVPERAILSKNIDLMIKFQSPMFQVWILHFNIAELLHSRCKFKSAHKQAGE
jgi:hypothetical protein